MAEKNNTPKTTTAANKGSSSGPINKMEAVRRALAKFGRNAKPLKIQGYIKDTYGIEMSNDRISNCKSEILRQARAKTKPAAPKKNASPPSTPKPAKAAPSDSGAGHGVAGSIRLQDIQAVKDLISRVGAGQLRILIDLFGK